MGASQSSFEPSINWQDPDQAQVMQIFKQQCQLYFSVKHVKKEKWAENILLFSGSEGLRLFNSWGLSSAEAKNPDTIWDRFLGHVYPKSISA